jgi:hypothetical protein
MWLRSAWRVSLQARKSSIMRCHSGLTFGQVADVAMVAIIASAFA